MKKCIVAFVFLMGMIAIANAQNITYINQRELEIYIPGYEDYQEDDHYFGDYSLDNIEVPVDSCLLHNAESLAKKRYSNFGEYCSDWSQVVEFENDSWVDLNYALTLSSLDTTNKRRLITYLPQGHEGEYGKVWVDWSYFVAVPLTVKQVYREGQRCDKIIYVVDSTSFFLIGKIDKNKRNIIHDESLTKHEIDCDAEVYTAIIGSGLLLFCNIPQKDMEMVCSSFMTLVEHKQAK
ncbi:MAG: hypothetical protein IJ761_07415 [Bacteroidales bacterium]|nr:hypothetical protein [Bacteroidales bacterium]